MQEASTPTNLYVHTDPLCPLAWRTCLWLRAVREQRPLAIQWKLFSLEVVNRKEGTVPDYVNGYGWVALRSLALARRLKGNEAFEKLYIALGNAAHGRKENIRERAVVEACAEEAGLGSDFVGDALADEATIQEVLDDHEGAVKRYHAFGVPTLALEGSDTGFYGPIIHAVPTGDAIGELWDYTAWALRQANLFELKRERSAATTPWGPVSA
jgi:predicted DsbA family dithiol-disulfide isomerase